VTWLIFNAFIVVLLALDLAVVNRRPHAVTARQALVWSIFWVALSLSVNLLIWAERGHDDAVDFFTCYVLEKSLSADNLFLFAVIFTSLGVVPELQHRVLYWGAMAAVVLRGTFIVAGTQLVQHFHWVLYVFAGFLLFTGLRMLLGTQKKFDPRSNPLLRVAQKCLPISDHFEGAKFFTRSGGRWLATPLLLALIVVEVVDIAFTVDSIPAMFAVTEDAFIIYASNILAVLGLRSFYFLLASAIARFRLLHTGLAIILILVGAKMVAAKWVHVPNIFALAAIVAVLAVTMLASVLTEKTTR